MLDHILLILHISVSIAIIIRVQDELILPLGH